ncbi:MAG: hypothetical protein CR975_03160 [Gammaproteobacteria bacterium]|nr:MAG: hypothetical protein CR975_03160 [Gammaproteobacteria bacterium]
MNENNFQQTDDEIDLTKVFKNLFKQRGLIMALALAFFLLGAAFQLSKLAFYTPKAVNYPISIEFITPSNIRYPNGTAFSPEDIITPENIRSALEKTKVGVGINQLTGAVSVAATNALINKAEESLLKQLANKKVTAAKLAETEKALESLKASARTYVTLEVDLSEVNLSADDAKKLLKAIVSSWAENAVEDGLITPNISYPEEPFTYDKKAVIVDNYDKLAIYGQHLVSAFANLSVLTGSNTVSVDGQNLSDLMRKVEGIMDNDIHVMRTYAYSISPALIKDNPLLEVQISSQLRVKELNRQEIEKRIRAYDEVLTKLGYSERKVGVGSTISLERQSAEANLDQSALNQLLDLGSKLSSSELRKKIVDRRMQAAESLFEIEKEIAMIKGNISNVPLLENQRKIIDSIPKIFKDAVDQLNESQRVFVALLKQYRKISLNKSNSLYAEVSSPYVTNPLSFPLKRTLIVLMAAALTGLFLGIVFVLVRSVFLDSTSKGAFS